MSANGDGGVRSALDALDRRRAQASSNVRHHHSDPTLIAELMTTSCLLELSKLTGALGDGATYAQQCADVVAQFLPLKGCAIDLTLPSGASINCVSGADDAAATAPIRLAGEVVGHLRLGRARTKLPLTEIAPRIADQVAAGLGTVLLAEHLRRTAATETALRLAVSLSADDIDRTLADLVACVAAWPGALAAALDIDHRGIGVPTGVRAGWWDSDDEDRHPITRAHRPGLMLEVKWTDRGAIVSSPSLEPLLDSIDDRLEELARALDLEAASETDPLTGLGNRRRLDRVLHAATRRAIQIGEPLSVAMCDLDHFKAVNDGAGHAIGDQVLMVTAELLRATVRTYDTVVRIGGEEFVIVAPATDALGMVALVERIRTQLPHHCRDLVADQTISIGVATVPHHANDADGALAAADRALYAAKSAGRDVVVVAAETTTAGEPVTGRLRSFVFRLRRR